MQMEEGACNISIYSMFIEEWPKMLHETPVKPLFQSYCKKLRRSPRLELKEMTQQKSRTINDGPLGHLEILPLELKFVLFSFLTIEDLSLLTIVSKTTRNYIELYKNSDNAKRHLFPNQVPVHTSLPLLEQAKHIDHFRRLGVLMKRSTCLYTTKDRLKLLQQFLQKYLCNFHKDCKNPRQCISLSCYGKFLNTVIAGWDEKECTKTFETFGASTLMLRNLNSIVKYKPGAYPSLELHVRLFYRRVFLRQTENSDDRSFWLELILKSFPMVHQARILYLLFGPMCGDEIQWYEMCESVPPSKELANKCFGDLSTAFRILYHHTPDWTEDAVISVMDELTNYPEDWLAENVANLLYQCGEEIALKVLHSKAINGRINELATIVTSLCLVCTKQGEKMSWVMSVVRDVTVVMENSRDRLLFLHAIVDMFKEIIFDMHEFDDDVDHDISLMLDAQADFTREVLLLAFKKMIPGS